MPKVKKVVLAGLLLAILIVFERFISVETQILRLSIAYVPVILIATLLGPVWGGLIGVLADLLGMMLMPKASFFAGFTLNALLTGVVYGVFLYNRPTNKSYLVRLIISVLIVHIFIHLGLTTLWLSIMYKRAFIVMLAGRLVANIIEIPIEIYSMFAIKIFMDKPVKKYLYEDTEYYGEHTVLAAGAANYGFKPILIGLGCFTALIIAALLPFHIAPEYGKVFPKEAFTFTRTLIIKDDVQKIKDRYAAATAPERSAIKEEPFARKLIEEGILDLVDTSAD
ncbi:folate family ECF transporter S component [Breznakiellaceae bacterium SP9]